MGANIVAHRYAMYVRNKREASKIKRFKRKKVFYMNERILWLI